MSNATVRDIARANVPAREISWVAVTGCGHEISASQAVSRGWGQKPHFPWVFGGFTVIWESWHGRCDRANRNEHHRGYPAECDRHHYDHDQTTAATITAVTAATLEPMRASTPAADWVEVHGDYLFNFAIGQVREVGLAEDLVQETFLAALRAQDRFAGKSSERTWLVGILRHKIYDHLRYACRERTVRADVPAASNGSNTNNNEEAWEKAAMWLHEVAAECQSPIRRLELEEFHANLRQALGKLPPRVAQVFQLYQVEERPNAEVCQQLNISESNLWVMLHRARRQLREHLRGWWRGDDHADHESLVQL